MQEIKKEYVSIFAQIHRDGSIQPLGILLEDGRKYDIDEVKDKCRAASLKAGGCGIRYTIRTGYDHFRQNGFAEFYVSQRYASRKFGI